MSVRRRLAPTAPDAGRRRLMTTGVAAASLAVLARSASAQPYPTPPEPGAPRAVAIDPPIEARLANGLRVIVARRPGVPLVTAELVALSGSETDPPRLSGLASMTASLLTQGTARRSAPEIAAAAEALGGSLGSGAGWNQSTVAITVTTPKLDAALALVAEVAREPAFAQAELDRLRTQTLDELKIAYANPGSLASLVAARLAYGAGPYGHPANGTPDSLPRIDRRDLITAHRRTFRPDNVVLILAGDVDAAVGLALARRHFGSWVPAASARAVSPDATPAAKGPEPVVAIVDMPVSGQAAVVLDVALPDRSPRERAVSAVLNGVLGGGYSSRINLEIRVKRGLSYGAGSQIASRRSGGLLHLTVQTKNDSTVEVARLLDEALDRLMTTPVPADELSARKASLIGGFSRAVETTGGLASVIAAFVVAGRSPSEVTTQIASLESVGANEVQRYAAAHLGRDRRRLAVAGEAKVFGAALDAARPGAVTIGAATLDLERPGGLVRP